MFQSTFNQVTSPQSLRLCGAIFFLFSTAVSAGELRVINTPHYAIHTDLNQRLAEDLAIRMEAMYRQYSVRLADFNPKQAAQFQVYLFNKRDDYSNLTRDKFPNTGGVFIQKQNLLAAFLEGQG